MQDTAFENELNLKKIVALVSKFPNLLSLEDINRFAIIHSKSLRLLNTIQNSFTICKVLWLKA